MHFARLANVYTSFVSEGWLGSRLISVLDSGRQAQKASPDYEEISQYNWIADATM